MLIDAVTRAAEKGEFGTVHILVGSETFLVERCITALRSAATAGGISGFNEDLFHGKGLKSEALVGAARTLPMMATQRFVLVRNVDGMASGELDRLADYVAAPAASTCLVLVAEKLDGRTRFAKVAKKLGLLADAQPLKPAGLRSFVSHEARRRGTPIETGAIDALLDAVGGDLAALDDAVERLSLYVGTGAPIGSDAIDHCIERVRVDSVWALVDAVTQRNGGRAMAAAVSLLNDREPPLKILALLARQLRMVGRMQGALAAGLHGPEAARAAGAPPFKARELGEAARRYGPRALTTAFSTLAEADLALKGSRRPPDTILQEALLRLCSRR